MSCYLFVIVWSPRYRTGTVPVISFYCLKVIWEQRHFECMCVGVYKCEVDLTKRCCSILARSKGMAEKRFSFVTERNVDKARDNRTPANTTKHTAWSNNVYRKWAEARNKRVHWFYWQQFKRVPNFEDLSITEIKYWLSRLSLEVRKRRRPCIQMRAIY